MSGPRDYSVGTRSALFALAKGTCYFPGCAEPVVREVEGFQTTNVQIAHIRGALPGSARYDDAMTDTERASFDNVMLLCKPHHDLIDTLAASEWSVSALREMKAEREAGGGAEALRGIPFTGNDLEDALREVVKDVTIRAVSVEISSGVETPAGWVRGPFEGIDAIRDANPHLSEADVSVVVTITNVGMVDSFVEEVAFYLRPEGARGEVPAVTLLGRNDYPHLNPLLPKRLRVGEATTWMTRVSTFRMLVVGASAVGVALTTAWAEVRLATGESIPSEDVGLDALPEV